MRFFLLLLLSLVTATEKDDCQKPLTQTAYRTAQTTITCEHPGNNKYTFFCRERSSVCEDILSTKPPLKSNKKFTLTETSRGFNVSISNVSSGDAAVYWCGRQKQSYRTTLRKIQLEVKDIKNFTKFPTVGQSFTYWCQYPEDSPKIKFICKGEDPSICQPLVTTETADTTSGRFSMKDDNEKRNITITVREVTLDDSGTYWCGGQSADETRSNPFFHRFNMTVGSPPPTTTEHRGDSQVVVTGIICAAVLLLLLFVLIFILVYKRFSKNERNAAATQHINEDYVYEEIQCVQNPDSGGARNMTQASANLPTNPSASLHYSTINFQYFSDTEAGGEALVPRPSSSACEYSSVRRSPIYSTVSKPSRASEDPLRSTVNMPQKL